MHRPTREQLTQLLRTRHGTLDETPYAVLLLALAAGGATAVLDLRRNQIQKTVVFDAGSPVDCRSNIATEVLSRFLVSTGKLSQPDETAALNASASRGVPMGEILTERKLLTPTELYRALQQNLGRKLLEPFSWKSGTYSISFDVPPAASVLRVKVPQLLVTGIQKIEPQETIDAAIAEARGSYLAIAEHPLFGLEDVRLSGNQQKVIDAARRAARLDELRSTAGIDSDDLNRILYAFLLLGAIELTEQPRREVPRAPVIPEAKPPAPAIDVALAEEVIAAYLSFRRKDAFDLLGVAEDAGLIPIIKAFLSMTERFLPSRFDEHAPDALREKAQEVFLASARAYAELADPSRRDALVRRRAKQREEAAAAEKAGPAALIDPEALWKNGRALAAAGKLREALSSFELAAECDAQNGNYAAEVAWCRYRLGVTPAPSAIKLLKNAIRIDPTSGVAHLYAGQVLAILSKRLEAEAYIDRAATLLPGDPRPAEAVKLLRSMER